jgi:eukaryotic-like serine/threonine-protein kinase
LNDYPSSYFKCNNLLPWRLIPFLDHCVDLIFLRRVGGGYIFVHRLLMEHFAEMYVEEKA